MMRAARTTAQRGKRGHRGDERVAVSVADAERHADAAPTTVSVHVPIAFRQRLGRKVLVAPEGTDQDALRAPQPRARSQRETTSAVRALARAFRWRRLLESGALASVHEIATAEKINPSYVSRVLRLTVLAPEIVEAIVKDSDQWGTSLHLLMQPFPVAWQHQLLSSYPIAL